MRSSRQSPEERKLVAHAVKCAAERGFAATVYAPTVIQFRGESPQTTADALAPHDAASIYDAAHRHLVLVVTPSEVYVLRDPSSDPPTRRQTFPVGVFLAHKALHGIIATEHDVETLLEHLARWPDSPGCTGENDPRLLPLHVFDAVGNWSGLADRAVAHRFNKRYGAGGLRNDDGNKTWVRTQEYHFPDALVIAGTPIQAGMHWDVQAVAGQATLRTSDQVWHLSGRHGYVNVLPNARVIKSERRSTAKLVWPRPGPG